MRNSLQNSLENSFENSLENSFENSHENSLEVLKQDPRFAVGDKIKRFRCVKFKFFHTRIHSAGPSEAVLARSEGAGAPRSAPRAVKSAPLRGSLPGAEWFPQARLNFAENIHNSQLCKFT